MLSVNNSRYDRLGNISRQPHSPSQEHACVMKVQSEAQISVSDKIDKFFIEVTQQVGGGYNSSNILPNYLFNT